MEGICVGEGWHAEGPDERELTLQEVEKELNGFVAKLLGKGFL